MTTTLYRPVNIVELQLIQDSNWIKFPPRLPEQPIFYPVTNLEYARQITVEWNLPTYKNGFVTAFDLPTDYLSKFKIEKVGLDHHTELWVQGEELNEFNMNILGTIQVTEGYHADPGVTYFYLEDKFQLTKGGFKLMGRFLEPDLNFNFENLALLNDIPILGQLDSVNKKSPDGQPRPEVVALTLADPSHSHQFETNKIYELKIAAGTKKR